MIDLLVLSPGARCPKAAEDTIRADVQRTENQEYEIAAAS